MKRQIMIAIAIGMFMTTIAVMSAQAQNAGINVTVPFDFSVSGKTLPAGDYVLRMDQSSSTLKIQNQKDASGTFVLVSPSNGLDIQNESKLVFNRYGSQHFLAQVWTAGRSKGEEMRKSKQERAIRSELAALKRTA